MKRDSGCNQHSLRTKECHKAVDVIKVQNGGSPGLVHKKTYLEVILEKFSIIADAAVR